MTHRERAAYNKGVESVLSANGVATDLIHDLIDEARHQRRLGEQYRDYSEFERLAGEVLRQIALTSTRARNNAD